MCLAVLAEGCADHIRTRYLHLYEKPQTFIFSCFNYAFTDFFTFEFYICQDVAVYAPDSVSEPF